MILRNLTYQKFGLRYAMVTISNKTVNNNVHNIKEYET